MTIELVLSVFVMLVLAFVGGHQLAVHRMTKRTHQAAKLRVGGTLDDACRFADHFTLVGKEMVCDHRGRMLHCAGKGCARCPYRYERPLTDAESKAGQQAWDRRVAELMREPVSAEHAHSLQGRRRPRTPLSADEEKKRQTGHLGTPVDRIPRRKPSRGNGHETPYARKKRAAKPKGKT